MGGPSELCSRTQLTGSGLPLKHYTPSQFWTVLQGSEPLLALKKAQRQKARKTRCELVDVFLQESEFTGHSPREADRRGGAVRPGQQAVAMFSLDSTGHAIPYMISDKARETLGPPASVPSRVSQHPKKNPHNPYLTPPHPRGAPSLLSVSAGSILRAFY